MATAAGYSGFIGTSPGWSVPFKRVAAPKGLGPGLAAGPAPTGAAEEVRGRAGGDEPEMSVSRERGDAAARGALQVALLDQEGLEDVLDRVGLLADGVRQVLHPDRPARELLDHREQELAVHEVEAERVDVEHAQRRLRHRTRDRAVGLDLRVVAHAPQKAVRDARRAARAPRDLGRPAVAEPHLEDARRAPHDPRELLLGIELQARHDAE